MKIARKYFWLAKFASLKTFLAGEICKKIFFAHEICNEIFLADELQKLSQSMVRKKTAFSFSLQIGGLIAVRISNFTLQDSYFHNNDGFMVDEMGFEDCNV